MPKRTYVQNGKAWEEIIGEPGMPGPPMTIRGQVPDVTQLPAAGVNGDAFITADDGHLHVWDPIALQWIDSGPIRGPKGEPGETLHPKGVVADINALPAAPAAMDVYVTQTGVQLYVYDPQSPVAIPAGQPGAGWVDMGKVEGPPGKDAYTGDPVPDHTRLPAQGHPGELRLTEDNGELWGWDEAHKRWVNAGRLRVPMTIVPWTAQVFTEGQLAEHANTLWLSTGVAVPGDEPGQVMPPLDTGNPDSTNPDPNGAGEFQMVTYAHASMASPAHGIFRYETFDFAAEALRRPVGFAMRMDFNDVTSPSSPFTFPNGAFAGQTTTNHDQTYFVNTGNPNVGTHGWIMQGDFTGPTTHHPESVWKPLGMPDGTNDKDILVWDAAAHLWESRPQPSSEPVGTIRWSMLATTEFMAELPVTERAKWAPCDGFADITGTRLAAIKGWTTTPNLVNRFPRIAPDFTMDGLGGQLAAGSTALPTTPFVIGDGGAHTHDNAHATNSGGHTHTATAANGGGTGASALTGAGGNHNHNTGTERDGTHHHTAPGGNNVSNNWDGGSSYDNILMVAAGSHTTHDSGNHWHRISDSGNHTHVIPAIAAHTHTIAVDAVGPHNHAVAMDPAVDHTHPITGGDAETAPEHVYMFAYIKVAA